MSDTSVSVLNASPDVINRPVLNTPYQQPTQHWELNPDDHRATNTPRDGRRPSGEYLMAPQAERSSAIQNPLGLARDAHQHPPHDRINDLRKRIIEWSDDDFRGVTVATRELLYHLHRSNRNPRPYFAQLDALHALIWLCEAGPTHDPKAHQRIMAGLRRDNEQHNDGMFRLATKMATGTGKTLLMQMIIAWRAINTTRPLRVLVIAPNLTVRDRLAELQPGRSHNGVPDPYRDLVPPALLPKVRRTKVIRCNYQQFQARDTRRVTGRDTPSGHARKRLRPYRDPMETPAELATRLLGPDEPYLVLNDEAHHCYRPDPTRRTNQGENAPAALWYSFLHHLHQAGRVTAIFDFSATPAFLQGHRTGIARTGQAENPLFPWLISDYPLIEAIEAGIVKIPRVPVRDDTGKDEPRFRHLYENTAPSKEFDANGRPPELLRQAIHQFHASYKQRNEHWDVPSPPVLIAVTADIDTATALYRYLAGTYDPETHTGTHGKYKIFSNMHEDGQPKTAPPTILVHSRIDDREEADSTRTTQNCLAEAKVHMPDHADAPVKSRLARLREIFRTVGRPDTLGGQIRCVISVSMLTEGWDAKNVTHILGFRPFGSQLLCEQVVGRGLRRAHTIPGADGKLSPDTVEVYGVPFSFLPTAKQKTQPGAPEHHVHAIAERQADFQLRLPAVQRYRRQPPVQRLELNPNKVTPYTISGGQIPTRVKNAGIIGAATVLSVDDQRTLRHHVLRLAHAVARSFVTEQPKDTRLLRNAVTLVEDFLSLPQVEFDTRHPARLSESPHTEKITQAILAATVSKDSRAAWRPVWPAGANHTQTTDEVDFYTANPQRVETRKSHVNFAVCDSKPETRLAECLDREPLVQAWARNAGLGFHIPYLDSKHGIWKRYEPDFIARLHVPKGVDSDDPTWPLYAIIEFKGAHLLPADDTKAKQDATELQWCPAVNHHAKQGQDPAIRGRYKYILLHRADSLAADLHLKLQDLQNSQQSSTLTGEPHG